MDEEFEFDEDSIEMVQPIKLDLSSVPVANGLCHNCCEIVETSKLFCDEDCKEDYKKQYFRSHGKYPPL